MHSDLAHRNARQVYHMRDLIAGGMAGEGGREETWATPFACDLSVFVDVSMNYILEDFP